MFLTSFDSLVSMLQIRLCPSNMCLETICDCLTGNLHTGCPCSPVYCFSVLKHWWQKFCYRWATAWCCVSLESFVYRSMLCSVWRQHSLLSWRCHVHVLSPTPPLLAPFSLSLPFISSPLCSKTCRRFCQIHPFVNPVKCYCMCSGDLYKGKINVKKTL